ncbi:MAG: GyrI-like domain-containing protein [Armatimonadota bacterium]
MEPKIVTRGEIKLIGNKYIGANLNGEIPALWDKQFLPRMSEIKNVVNGNASYGLCECMCKGECKCGQGAEFYYIAAMEVSSFDEVPDGMSTKTVPAAKYAVFTHKGPVSKLHDTFQKIYTEWIPASGLEIAGNYCFEYYGGCFDNSENSLMDIYVPLK